MSGGAIAAIVVGGLVLILVVIGILAAIAVPVFLNQREKAADAAARASVDDIATEIGLVPLDNPSGSSTVEAVGSIVTISALDGTMRTSILEPGVNFGGYVIGDGNDWCVWVYAPKGLKKDFQYSTWNGLEQGNCSLSG